MHAKTEYKSYRNRFINFPDELWEQIRHHCGVDKTIKQFMIEAAEEKLAREAQEEARR